MRISIIIVSYNVKHFVEQCLLSIFRSQGISLNELEVYVVDNCSKDDTIAYLRCHFPVAIYPHLHLIANKRNVGFGKANNQVLDRVRGKYVLFLNPDTLLTERTLADAFAEAELHPDLGAMGVKMLHTNGSFALESRRGVPSPWVSLCKMSGLTSLFPKSPRWGKYYMQYLPLDRATQIEVVSGAFMMIPLAALRKVGSFDETFFMYGEDIDLSFRLLKAGYHNYYCPTSILHYKGESTKKNTYRYVHVFYEAMLIFFRKHYRHYNILLSLPIKSAILMRAAMALVMQQMRELNRFLHPRQSKDETESMLYIGRASDAVRQLAEEYGLNMDYLSADESFLPQGHLSSQLANRSYGCVVYDTMNFSVHTFLRLFESSVHPHCHIGTFNPKRGVLITPSRVFEK